jgi:DeoR-like helix-turn-helix domain
MDNTEIQQIDTAKSVDNKANSLATSGPEADFFAVTKKTEKLASAVYLITGLLSDSEPMKWSLRKKVSELLSFVLTYKNIRQSEFPAFVQVVNAKVAEVISLMEVSVLGGLISQMNFAIIEKEFGNLTTIISSLTNKTDVTNNIIPVSFFDASQFVSAPTEYARSVVKDNVSVKDIGVFKSNNRQGIILGLLKKKKELSIKDIAMVIKDVSEKTIQRELVSLIDAGVISKTGERRWSKYSLKTTN